MKIISRWLSKDCLIIFTAITLVLTLISVIVLLAQYLNAVLEGEVLADLMLPLIALSLPTNLLVILPLAFFLALMLLLGRMHSDSEIQVLNASGLGNWGIIKSLLPATTIVLTLLTLLALYLNPLSLQKFERLFSEKDGIDFLDNFTADKLMTINRQTAIYSPTKIDENSWQDILIMQQKDNGWQVTLAPSAKKSWQTDFGGKYLVLNNNEIYSANWQEATSQKQKNAISYWHIPQQTSIFNLNRLEAYSTPQLIKMTKNEARAQLQWRLSQPFLIIELFLLAIPLANTKNNRARGTYRRLPLAVISYLLYMMLLFASKNYIAQGLLPAMPGMLLAHGLVLAAIGYYYYRQK